MANPFDSLREEREAEEARLHQAQADRVAAEKQFEDSRVRQLRQLAALASQYTDMVDRVMQQLSEARYPGHQLERPGANPEALYRLTGDPDKWRPRWTISHPAYNDGDYVMGNYKVSDYRAAGTVIDVSVMIDLDADGRPHLVCSRGAKTAACALNETDLIRTLRDLHNETAHSKRA